MKRIPCSYEFCGARRPHWMNPDEERGNNLVEVPDDFSEKAYCSLTCAMMAGHMTARATPTKREFHKKNSCVSFLEGGILCEDCDPEGHSRLCNWHRDWHACDCGALEEMSSKKSKKVKNAEK